MKTRRQILKIREIVVESKLYPRIESDSETSKRYAEAMESGADFPPVVVAEKNKKYYLVDGKHRLDAYDLNKKEVVDVEVLMGLNEREIFIESVKRNIGHGRPFSEEDINEIKITLEDFNLGIEQVSEIVRIPVTKLKPFVAKKIESHYDEDFAQGEEIQGSLKKEHIEDKHLISSEGREIKRRKEEERVKNRYTIENFMCQLYGYSRKVEDFLKNLDVEELNNKDFKKEADLLLEKISKTKKYLNRIEKVLKEIVGKDISQWSQVQKYKRKETEEQKIQRLLDEEREYSNQEIEEDVY